MSREKKAPRYLRDVEGFQAAAEEVIRRCAPSPFKRSIAKAGAWIPPESVTVVTPALLYGLCVGMDRQKHHLYLEAAAKEERGPDNVVQLHRKRTTGHITEFLQHREATTARWLPAYGLDGIDARGEPAFDRTERLGYEPSVAEFRAGLFGMGEGTP